ncbi:DUF1707 domain-containing protein [Actinomycetospora endophytica]|uniref:DUF1707 domain-containing protein n=1 Tax=Actinomycetospora endophytica TaxID=2291215 RepID=A0ABS8P2R7_9PSEU|nr:DUF1707 domain-containing protein [Actinomycetospora endophytica]MCD2192528.1 DUF1707 domain-containing protein [Actinomycetospora endophytica]
MAEQGAMRVSDADRAQAADRLTQAHGEGRLTLAEYDERVRAAHGAVVRDDLAPLLTDLPSAAPEPARAAPRPRAVPHGFPAPPVPLGPGSGGLRGAVAAWAFISAVNVLIWLAVTLGSGAAVYPWWIWVAGPWGLALLLGAAGRAGRTPCTGGRPSS